MSRFDGSDDPRTRAELIDELGRVEERVRMLETAAYGVPRAPEDRAGAERGPETDRLRELIDLIPLMVHVKDADGRFLLANRASHEAYGVEPGALVGMLQAHTHIGELAGQYNAVDRMVIESGEPRVFPGDPFTRADDEQRIIDWIKVPWPHFNGDRPAVLIVGQDVTERASTDSNVRRQERLVALGQLTATVSHELRNPLAVLRPSLGTLRRLLGPNLDDAVLPVIERLDRSVARCERIIAQLLDFTRIRDLAPRAVDLNAWLTGVLDDQERPAGLHVDVRLADGELPARIDPHRLQQAVINVFTNACDALRSPADPERARDGAELRVRTLMDGDRIELHFQDNGAGMEAEALEHAFEPLFSTKGFGTGLGLAIVRQIMDQHDGGVTIRSDPGAGTRVMLWLPAPPRTQREKPGPG